MNKYKTYKSGRDICISVFLVVTMALRLVTENASLFAVFALISLVAAVYDIYIAIEREYSYYRRRFFIVRGVFIVGGVFCTIIVAIAAIFRWNVNALVVDELSILALLASLPKEFHCHLLGKYIRGSEEKQS